MLLGAHLSIAGGLHHALEKAHQYRFDCLGMFVRNQRQWHATALDGDAVEVFRETRRRLRIGPIVAHSSYLLNLAGRSDIRRKSIAALTGELRRCARLGIDFYVIHPGSARDAEEGAEKIAGALNAAAGALETPSPVILLETSAGQGNCLGWRFQALARMLDMLGRQARFGVCLDTCHVFAAGYDIRSGESYRATMDEFDGTVGLDSLKAVHLNDSLGPLGSRIDRHAHIGTGEIGLAGFSNLVNNPALARMPMILETPKGFDRRGRDYDELNADAIRSLTKSGSRRRSVQTSA